MPDPTKKERGGGLDKNEKLKQEYDKKIEDVNSEFQERYDIQNMKTFPGEIDKNNPEHLGTIARGGGLVDKFGKPLSAVRIKSKQDASLEIATSGRFGMLDIVYGFGLNFNKFEEGGE